MRNSTAIPVRLSNEMIQRLEKVAREMGLSSRTAIIKMCTSSFLEYFEKNGVAGLPLDWKQILHDLDGRTHRYHNEPTLMRVAEKGAEYIVKPRREKSRGE